MKLPKILIVEDDVWLAEQHARTLQTAGFKVSYALHALSALDIIDEAKPDAIVLDLFLAGPNGLVLLHELRSHNDIGQIPVVVCTNSTDTFAPEDLVAYGVSRVLDKATMTPNMLVAAVNKVLI
jgi:DNA-binding response OmpR family regulator